MATAAQAKAYLERTRESRRNRRNEIWRKSYRKHRAKRLAHAKANYYPKRRAAYQAAREQSAARMRQYARRARNTLQDNYVRKSLAAWSSIPQRNWPDEMVQLQRASLAVKRLLRTR